MNMSTSEEEPGCLTVFLIELWLITVVAGIAFKLDEEEMCHIVLGSLY